MGTKLSPDSSESWWSLADVYDQMGKHKNAKQAIDKALSLNSEDPNALLISAYIMDRYQNKKNQMPSFKKAIEIVSNNDKKFRYLDPLLEAVRDLKSHSNTNLTKLAVKIAQSKPWSSEGLYAGLLAEHAAVITDNIKALIDYTEVLIYLNENNKALEVLENAQKSNPNNPSLLLNLGFTYERLSRTNSALNAFRKASRLFKTDNSESARDRRIAFSKSASILFQQGKRVKAYQERIKGKIVPRQKTTNIKHIDLSSHYNAPLDERWFGLSRERGPLSQMPTGLADLNGTKFDLRGIVQLSGRQLQNQLGENNPFTGSAKSIDLSNQTYKSISFLHATTWTDPDGTPVANYVFNYVDGTKNVLPIVYGEHVRDWYVDADIGVLDTPKSKIAWRSTAGALYQTNWVNPHPEKEIQSIDLESQMGYSNVFVIGITGNPDSAGEGEQSVDGN